MMNDEEKYKKLREQMVREQLIRNGIKDERVLDAMRRVPRHLFVLPQDRDIAYEDYPLPIGFGQTISQPYIVAFMAEHLELKKTDKVMEIGTGSGYAAAIMAELAGVVHTLEIVDQFYERNCKLLAHAMYKNVICNLRDGYRGLPEEAPFDKIALAAAPPEVPQILLEELAVGGRLIAPIGPIKLFQRLVMYDKLADKKYKATELMGVSFVEMVREP